jgi:hypothetical protein
MSKAPKRPSKRDDLKQRNEQDVVPRPTSSSGKPRAASKRRAEVVPAPPSAEIFSGSTDSPERTIAVKSPVAHEALPEARSLRAEVNPIIEDRQGPTGEIREEPQQHGQPFTSQEILPPKELDQHIASDLPQPGEEVGMQHDEKQETSQHHPMVYELTTENHEDRNGLFRTGLAGTVQRVIKVWSPHLQAASDRVRGSSGRVKVWAQGRATRSARESDKVEGSANPVYIVAAITLGIPALLLIPLVGMNPGVQEGTFVTIVTFLVASAFITAAVFEIKRLADQPFDESDH